jgi:hypothetical protein
MKGLVDKSMGIVTRIAEALYRRVVYYESIKRKLKTKYIWGVGVMKDYNLTLRNLRASHTLSKFF